MLVRRIILSLFVLLFTAVFSYAEGNSSADDKGDIEQAINTYVKSIDTQNADNLQKTIVQHGSIVTLNKITNKIDDYTASDFVALVKSHQKGGWVRNVSINSVEVNGTTATAKVEISDARLLRSGFFTLVKEGNTWKVASEVTSLELKKK